MCVRTFSLSAPTRSHPHCCSPDLPLSCFPCPAAMDNLRLEHPGTFSSRSPAGAHHLLPFTPPAIEFPPQLHRPTLSTAQQDSIPFSSSWASLLAEPSYPQTSSTTLHKQALPSPDRAIRTWDVAAESILQQKQGHPIDNSTEFSQCASSALDVLRGDSPILQLKHGSDLMSSEFGHLGAPMGAIRADTCNMLGENGFNGFRKDDLHLPGLFGAVERGDASPMSVVSGAHPSSLACKLDPFTVRDQRFGSFAWHEDEDSERAFKGSPAFVKTEVMGENSMGLTESFRDHHKETSASNRKGIIVKKEQEEGVTIASLEDGSIGLRLGKRTYYGDVGGAEEGSRRANSSSNCCNGSGAKNGSSRNSSNVSSATTTTTANTITNTNTAATATTNGSNTNSVMLPAAAVKSTSGGGISSKKQKGSSASPVVPMCQAEGCAADLSGAKDYHRRHKVCEFHSKVINAKVNNIEQRFCQQCSRFHILSAFDEGKRSCRRRLAGHNERRRKPPPEPLPFLSPGGFAYFADGRVNTAREHPYFLQHRRASLPPSSIDNTVLACQLGIASFAQQEAMGSYQAMEFHRFMQGLPPGRGSGVGVLDGVGTLMLTNGNALALSTGLSLPASASSSSVGLLPHVSSEMAISGRALSLLSPSLGSPETMSISLGMTNASMDQILAETHGLTSLRQQVVSKSTSCFSSGFGMSSALHGLPQSHNHALNSLTSSSSGCSTDIDQGDPPMSNFEGRSLFLMHSENSFQNMQDAGNSQHGRPVLDLMQISSEERHQQRSQPDLPYVDLPGLTIFNQQSMM